MADDLDTDAAGILIGNGLDAPTSIAGSIRDAEDARPSGNHVLGLAGALVVMLVMLIVFWLLS